MLLARTFIDSKNIKKVYYKGSAEDFEKIDVDKYNELIDGSTIYYYSETSVTDGAHWHYTESGEIEVWS